jgi:hypothetical protein
VEFPEEERAFVLEFMRRTLEVVQNYSGPRDASILFNCLLGLLVVPKEKMFAHIPTDPLGSLHEWGIDPAVIKARKCECGERYPKTVRHLVRCLRNAVAHFNVRPINEGGACVGFRLSNGDFRVDLRVREMRAFVEKLAEHLRRVVGGS